MILQLFSELKRTSIQVILSGAFLLMNIEIITWIVLAFWGIRLAAHVLKKESGRSVVYVYR